MIKFFKNLGNKATKTTSNTVYHATKSTGEIIGSGVKGAVSGLAKGVMDGGLSEEEEVMAKETRKSFFVALWSSIVSLLMLPFVLETFLLRLLAWFLFVVFFISLISSVVLTYLHYQTL